MTQGAGCGAKGAGRKERGERRGARGAGRKAQGERRRANPGSLHGTRYFQRIFSGFHLFLGTSSPVG